MLDGSFQDESERLQTVQDSMAGTKMDALSGEFPIERKTARDFGDKPDLDKLDPRGDTAEGDRKLTAVVKDEIADKKAKE